MRSWVGFLGRSLLLCVLSLGLSTATSAVEQTKDQQKCTNAMNKAFAKMAKTQAKEICGCIKNKAKGKIDKLGPGGTAESCSTGDVKGKVAKTRLKTLGAFGKKCVGLICVARAC